MREESEGKFIRLAYVVLFYLIYSISDVVLLVIAVLQSVLNIFTNEPSRTLTDFGSSLSTYLKQIAEYLSYSSEFKPFPFNDWPEPARTDEAAEKDVEA